MPLKSESLIKVYCGTRLVGPSRPVIVAVGDTTYEKSPFGEFYVFHELSGIPFLYQRTRCSYADDVYPFDFGEYLDVFSASALLESEFSAARDRLEFEVSNKNLDLHRDLFCSAAPLTYEGTGELSLFRFRIFQRFQKELETMVEFSKSRIIRELKHKLARLPQAVLNYEPPIKKN